MKAQKLILIVDDEPNLYLSLQAILQREGFAVHTAVCTQDAFTYLRHNHYTLMVLDLGLPDLDGISLLSMCKRLYPNLPILVLTGNNSVDSTLKALRLGARGYLNKPVNPQQILYCIEEILNEYERLRLGTSRVRPSHLRRKVLTELEEE